MLPTKAFCFVELHVCYRRRHSVSWKEEHSDRPCKKVSNQVRILTSYNYYSSPRHGKCRYRRVGPFRDLNYFSPIPLISFTPSPSSKPTPFFPLTFFTASVAIDEVAFSGLELLLPHPPYLIHAFSLIQTHTSSSVDIRDPGVRCALPLLFMRYKQTAR